MVRVMKKVQPLLVISSFAFALSSFMTAQATNYYVDSASGSDSNSGTLPSAPWKTLSKVNNTTFQAGTTINFKRGSVWSGNLQIKNSGTSASPITYQAYDTGNPPQIKDPGVTYGHSINITGDYNVVKDFLLTDAHEAGVMIQSGADHNIVSNNDITTSGTGVTIRGQFNLITKNHVHDLTMIVDDTSPSNDYGAVCFWLSAGNNEISYNRGINCKAHSYDFGFDGGFVEVYNQGDNSNIHHNYAENTGGFFELGAGGGGSAQNVKVAYNVMYNTNGGVCFNQGSYDISVSNFRFEHNTYVATSGSAGYRVFFCTNDYSPVQARNNVFYSNLQIANNGNFSHTNNLYYMTNMVNGSGVGYTLGSGEKMGDPLFANLEAKDMHLTSASPAIDAGADLGYNKDYDDRTVPVGSAADMGAYEFGAATGVPSPPRNLRIAQ
jgi:hypothetical protein